MAQIETVDVLQHLGESLRTGWRRYRKRLKRCQKHFSEDAVHAARVETRRLLSTLELVGAFIPEPDLRKARRSLKRHLDVFDRLRDTQVQLNYVGRMATTFSDAWPFHRWLEKRRERFARKTRRSVKQIKSRRLSRRIAAFQKELRRQRKKTAPKEAIIMVQRAIHRAFQRVAVLCRDVRAADTQTIHRTRLAFKRFRYMVEAMGPLLPSVTREHLRAMRGYQCMMGDIQDFEVLLAAWNKYARKGEIETAAARRLKIELTRWRRMLIRIYLNAAGRLQRFWPPSSVPKRANPSP